MSGLKRALPSVVHNAQPAAKSRKRASEPITQHTNNQNAHQSTSQRADQVDLTNETDSSTRRVVSLLDLPGVLLIEILAHFRLVELNAYQSINRQIQQVLSYTRRSPADQSASSSIPSSLQQSNDQSSQSSIRSSIRPVDILHHWTCLSLHAASFGPADHEQIITEYSRFHLDAEMNMFMNSMTHNREIDELLAAGPYPRVTIVRIGRWTVSEANLKKLLQACPNIYTLYMSYSSQNSDDFMQLIAHTLPHLKGVHFDLSAVPRQRFIMFMTCMIPLTTLPLVEITLQLSPLSAAIGTHTGGAYKVVCSMPSLRYVNVEADARAASLWYGLPCPKSLNEAHYQRLELSCALLLKLAALPNLRVLDLTRGEKRLDLKRDNFNGNAPVQRQLVDLCLKNVSRLDLSEMKNFINVFPSIRYLDLSFTPVVGTSVLKLALTELPELRSLNLARCWKVNDKAWLDIKPKKLIAKQLQYLDIEHDTSVEKDNVITGVAVRHIATLFPDLRSFNVAYHHAVDSDALHSVMSLPHLHTLNVAGTNVSLTCIAKSFTEQRFSRLSDVYVWIGQCYQSTEQRLSLSAAREDAAVQRVKLGVQSRDWLWNHTDYRVHLHVATELHPQMEWNTTKNN